MGMVLPDFELPAHKYEVSWPGTALFAVTAKLEKGGWNSRGFFYNMSTSIVCSTPLSFMALMCGELHPEKSIIRQSVTVVV